MSSSTDDEHEKIDFTNIFKEYEKKKYQEYMKKRKEEEFNIRAEIEEQEKNIKKITSRIIKDLEEKRLKEKEKEKEKRLKKIIYDSQSKEKEEERKKMMYEKLDKAYKESDKLNKNIQSIIKIKIKKKKSKNPSKHRAHSAVSTSRDNTEAKASTNETKPKHKSRKQDVFIENKAESTDTPQPPKKSEMSLDNWNDSQTIEENVENITETSPSNTGQSQNEEKTTEL
ncbi:hypothetical protein NEFER03_0880 [Nematocida sp. LUAm3]|nr:hypothetical protein NEFER03_0880 [Nematocida sp. LUAm3]